MSLKSAHSTSAPVKWKARKISAMRHFFESFQPVVTHTSNLSADSPDRQDCLEIFQHNVGSQEELVEVNKVTIKPHTLEVEKVMPSVGADMEESAQFGSEFALDLDEVVNQVKVNDIENSEHEFSRIRIYPSPKRRNIPVDRDFPIGLEQFAQQVEQEMSKPLVSTDDIESEQSLVNTRTVIFGDDTILESDRPEMGVAHDQDESVKEESTYMTDSRISTVANVPRRRISAVRCFPPGCRRGAAYLREEDLKRALASSKNHCLSCQKDEEEVMDEEEVQVVVEQGDDEMEGEENDDEDESEKDDAEVEVEVEEEEEEKGEEDDVEVEVEEGSEEEDIEVGVVGEEGEEDNVEVEVVEEEEGEEDSVQVEMVEEDKKDDDVVEEQEEVVMMTDNETESMKTKLEGERVVVLALSASRCPCSQNAGAKPTAGGLKKGKEITTTDCKEEQRVVVQALMASSKCQWRRHNQRRPTKPKFVR